MRIYPEGYIQGKYRQCIYLCLRKKLTVSENAYISIIEIMFKINFRMFIHETLGNEDSCFISDTGKVGEIILDEKLTQKPWGKKSTRMVIRIQIRSQFLSPVNIFSNIIFICPTFALGKYIEYGA